MKKFLILYYGFLQSCHLLALLSGLASGMDKVMLQISPGLTGEKFELMMFSTYIDIFIAAPLGILFVYGYTKKKAWASGVGFISITTAFISALYYVYLLWLFSLWHLTWLNNLISIGFIPMFLLFGATCLATVRGENYLAPSP